MSLLASRCQPGCVRILGFFGGVKLRSRLVCLPSLVALDRLLLELERVRVRLQCLTPRFGQPPSALLLDQPAGLDRGDRREALHLWIAAHTGLVGVVLVLERRRRAQLLGAL